MFDEFLEKMKLESFNVKEIVVDKDSSENPIFYNYCQKWYSPNAPDTQQRHSTRAKNQPNA